MGTEYSKRPVSAPGFAVSEPDGSNPGWFHSDRQLTATNINNLLGTNIELVAAPGANLALIPHSVFLFLAAGGVDFVQVNNSDQLAIRYSATTEISELGTEAQVTSFLEAVGADAALYAANLLAASPAGFVPIANTALDLDNNGAAEYTTGDGTLSVRVFYSVVPMAAFS